MKKLKNLINSLDKNELKSLKDKYDLKNEGAQNKKALLLKYLIKSKDISDQEAARFIYNKAPNTAFSQLKSRLKKDVLDVLLTQHCIDTKCKDEGSQEFMILRQFMYGKLLMMKGVECEGMKILIKSAKQAKDMEFSALYILIKEFIMNYHIQMKDDKLAMKTAAEINQAVVVFKGLHEIKQKIHNKDLLSEIELIDEESKHIKSNRAVLWTLRSTYLKLKTEGDFHSAFVHLLKIRKHVEKNYCLSTKKRMLELRIEIVEMLINIGRNIIADNVLTKTQIEDATIPQLISLKRLRLILLVRAGKNKESIELIDETRKLLINLNKEQQQLEWSYFKAYLLFLEKDYKLSAKILNKEVLSNRVISEDLNIYSRILEIQNLIQLKDLDWCVYRLDTFRKFLITNKGKQIERYNLIFKTLNYLERDALNTIDYKIKLTKLVENLQTRDCHITWRKTGFELLDISEWVSNRMKIIGEKSKIISY